MTDGPIMDAINTYYDTHPDDEEKDARMAEEDTDLSLQDQEFDSVQERMTSEESERHDEALLVPADGWPPEDFPQITVDLIPYTASILTRPDPCISITPDGWIYIELGNVRLAIPNEDEWLKLAVMVARMLNSWRLNQQDDFPPPTRGDLDDFFASTPPLLPPPGEMESMMGGESAQEATAAAIGGIAAPKAFEDMIHQAVLRPGDVSIHEEADQEAQTKE